MERSESNYIVAMEAARKLFLTYGQEEIIQSFQLVHDAEYLYLHFIACLYRVERSSGRVEKKTKGCWTRETPGFEEVMSIYDLLCNKNGRPVLSGVWQSVPEMNRLKSGAKSLESGLNSREESFFSGKGEALAAACRSLGGQLAPVGDVAYYLPVFDDMTVYFQFWEADEDFPAQIRILWDQNTLDYLHFETTFYITGFLLHRLAEDIRKREEAK